MTAATTNAIPSTPVAAHQASATGRVRDLRLDFFRGLAMFIILFAHTPGIKVVVPSSPYDAKGLMTEAIRL